METKNDEIRISTDAMIALVVTEAEERELAEMPSLQEMNEAFQPSEQFQQKMDKLLRTARSKERARQRRRAFNRTAVCFMALVTLCTCIMMPAHAVREAVVATLIEWHDKFMSIVYSSDDAKERLLPERIELAYIPDGFALQEPILQNEQRFLAEYTSNFDHFYVRITCMEDQTQISIDNEYTTVYSIQFSDCDAVWGISDKGVNTLAWEKNHFVYQISGSIDLKTMIQIAENIKM